MATLFYWSDKKQVSLWKQSKDMFSTPDIYNSLLSVIRKDKRGLAISPEDFNHAVVPVNQRIYRLAYERFESSKLVMDELDFLKVIGTEITLTSGKGTLPDDYMHLVGDPYYVHATAGTRKVELVTSLEHRNREMDYLSKSTDLYPLARLGYSESATPEDMTIWVTPTTISSVFIDYLRTVDTPFLDYYVNDTTLEVTLLNASEVAISIPSGVTLADGTTGPVASYVSKTVDFEWHPHDVPSLISLLLETMGIILGDQFITGIAVNELPRIEEGK